MTTLRALIAAGLVVGAYTLRAPLGQGGMGSVWLADRSDGRYTGHAAVKLDANLIGPRVIVGVGDDERVAVSEAGRCAPILQSSGDVRRVPAAVPDALQRFFERHGGLQDGVDAAGSGGPVGRRPEGLERAIDGSRILPRGGCRDHSGGEAAGENRGGQYAHSAL